MSGPIGVAVIGSGIFAKEEHLPAILATPSLSLKAVYSRTLKSASSMTAHLSQKVDWYSEETAEQGRGLSDMLTNTNIKAVIIALPIVAQPEYIRAALKAGKHVLSEKPVAKDVATAQELVTWYRHSGEVDPERVNWSVAENYRFLDSHRFAAESVGKMGRVLGFRAKVNRNMQVGNKYFETAWRKTPEYQGGFLLDGGVHFIATMRILLGEKDALERVSAFTCQLREHLPPVDTVNATLKTKTGVSGTFSVSMGTTFQGAGYTVACEKGTVTVGKCHVEVVSDDGQAISQSFSEEGSGVKQEVAAWAEGISGGKWDAGLMPDEALKDLEVLEALLRSGDHNGSPMDLKLQ